MLKINGITLTSLVIIIVILIIIAGVVINLSLGENGLLSKAKQAKEQTNLQAATEKMNLKITTAQINNYSENQEMISLKELALILKEDDEIEYVTEQKTNINYEISENPKSIFTKLKDYPYEFEITSSLELLLTNDEKVETNNSVGIYRIGTYNSVGVSAGATLIDRLISANTINISIKERYSDYAKLTKNNFLAVDSVSSGKGYPSMTTAAKEVHSYSSQIKNYDANTGVLTILKPFGCFDDGHNTYDTCFLGTTTIYLVENAEIPDL